MEEKPKFEICRSINGNLCVTVNSLDYILTEKMYGDSLKLRKEDQDLVGAVLGRIRYDLNSCIREHMEDELRGKVSEYCQNDEDSLMQFCKVMKETNGRKTKV